ncbi:MBL fold metallo-hydrolase [Roseibium denhamense]|uniref:Phosphoribosyl 1,2-cyclic phosphate phosphodiesterase n=1 Tax=Roseibium denhamense TaxID=76305 RepID=A0ABY1PCY2_9HYPH|nr:MBL fold metallo-hydrolase [Roseibium denhamense]MTI07843.1 MBL fold metallo-hydrolase [Roseibium denhamense]SMP31713.1 phosphoribosyl 1,2-cyclic phosphate phosphodiesterase [Roseibium denhamense]
MSLKFTILGCGSSGGVPRIGNDWGQCDPANPKNRRLRCSLLVEKFGENGCTTVLIDTGPDVRQQLLDADVQHVDGVVYTHAHADHLHGIDDLRVFMIRSKKRVPVYMNDATLERAMAAFGYCFETPQGSSYPPILDHHGIVSNTPIRISGAGGVVSLEPIEVVHGDILALGFRIDGIAYIPDVSDIPNESLSRLEGLDVLILDCLRRNPHPSHFCLADALAWTQRIAPKRAIFTNLHNDLDYQTLLAELPDRIKPAYDGMTVQLDALEAVVSAQMHV